MKIFILLIFVSLNLYAEVKVSVYKKSNGALVAQDKGITVDIEKLRQKTIKKRGIDILDGSYNIVEEDITAQVLAEEKADKFRREMPTYEDLFRAIMEDLNNNKDPINALKLWYDNNK